MYIETERLIIRDLIEQDAEALLEMKNDEQVMRYPFFQGDETIDYIKIMLAFFQRVKGKGLIIDAQYPERGNLFAICLKDSGDVIGIISVHSSKYSYEVHMGWYMKSHYTRMGYASEAGAAASDYLLEELSLEYISAGVANDNLASFRTAQKSGFRLYEKRSGDYNNNNGSMDEEYETGSCGYHFRKFNKTSHNYQNF